MSKQNNLKRAFGTPAQSHNNEVENPVKYHNNEIEKAVQSHNKGIEKGNEVKFFPRAPIPPQVLNDFLQKHVLKKRRFTSNDWFSSTHDHQDLISLTNTTIFTDDYNEDSPATSALNSFSSIDQDLLRPESSAQVSQSTQKENLYPAQICNPTDLDVLLGRGGSTNTHPGNIRYRQEVEKIRSWYSSCTTKSEKKEVSQLLIEYVNEYGGRFLVKDGSTQQWVLANPKTARKKTSQALRDSQKWKTSDHFEIVRNDPDPGGS